MKYWACEIFSGGPREWRHMVDIKVAKVSFVSFEFTVTSIAIVYIILHGKMSSSDDPDTNTSDKCVSGERNRDRERDSGVVCVLVTWSRIGPSPLRGRPLFWLNQTNKTGYYTSSCRFKGKIWQSDNSWYKVSKIFNGISSGPACLQFAFH